MIHNSDMLLFNIVYCCFCAALIGAVTIAMELFSKDPEANQRSRGVHAKVK